MASTKRTKKNNNPTGRNQYSGGVLDLAREKPIAAAAVAAGAAATGLFLWSKRAQISDQLTNLSDQISEWSDSIRSTDETETEAFIAGTPRGRKAKGKTQTQLSEEALTLKQTGEDF